MKKNLRKNLLKKDGIAALACIASASEGASFLQCTFQVKHQSENEREYATFSLQYKTHIPGIEDEQAFDLMYHADNLRPTTTKCQISAYTLLNKEDEIYIARNGPPDVRVLSLDLWKPCSIICPSVVSCQIPSQRFVDLAKSTHIEIVFDWKWLDPQRVQLFTKIVSQPERLKGFDVDPNNLRGRRLGDWTIFSPKEENVVVSQEPPPYTGPVHKRPRQISSSSPSPSTKRVFVIPPGSPTEIATTASPPDSPKHPSSTSDKSQRTTYFHSMSARSCSHNEKLYSPKAKTDTNASSASKENICGIILELLTSICTSFIDRPHSASPSLSSPTGLNAQSTTASSLKSILGSLLSKCDAVVTEKFRIILQNMEDEANLLRQEADEEFLAVVEEEKLDMTQLKEDALEEVGIKIDKVVQEELDKFSSELDWLVEQARAEVKHAVHTRVERDMNTTWEKAIARSLLDQKTQIGNKVIRKGYTAGDPKRRSFQFRSCAR